MEDSLKKRYSIKLLASVVSGLIGIILVAIVPKALGPVSFGQFSYLQQFFAQIIAFLDAGTSTAFFTKLSARNGRKELILFYALFSGFLLFVLILLFVFADYFSYLESSLPNIPLQYIYLGLGFGYLSWLLQIFIKISDAYALTVSVEIIKIIHKIFSLLLLLVLVNYYVLDLERYFYFNYFVLILFIGITSVLFVKKGIFTRGSWSLRLDYKKLVKEFTKYTTPLFIFNIVGIFVGLFDIWLLQKVSGSIETGFYGLAYSIAAMCFLFTGAMTPIITREFSKSFAENDIDKIRSLFQRYIPMLYAIAAYFGVFIAFQSENLLYIFTDDKFKEAYFALVIMAFYPLHQTYGQLSASLFFASENTRQYKNIGIIVSFIGLLFSLVLVYILELGAVGFAWKMVLVQIISVNIQVFYNTKYLKISFLPFVKHQIYTIVFFSMFAFLSYLVSNNLESHLWSFLISGAMYSILVIVGIFYFPQVMALKKDELFKNLRQLKWKVKNG